MIPLQCEYCKILYYVKPYRKDKSRCCSRQCLWHITKSIREPNRLSSISGKKAHNNAGSFINCQRCNKRIDLSPHHLHKRKYCSNECKNSNARHEKLSYIRITVNGERRLEHRYLMEQFLQRPLHKDEDVHHINGQTKDNRLENLMVLSKADHTRLHHKDRNI